MKKVTYIGQRETTKGYLSHFVQEEEGGTEWGRKQLIPGGGLKIGMIFICDDLGKLILQEETAPLERIIQWEGDELRAVEAVRQRNLRKNKKVESPIKDFISIFKKYPELKSWEWSGIYSIAQRKHFND